MFNSYICCANCLGNTTINKLTLTTHKIVAKQNLTRGKNKKFMISLIYECSGLNFSAGLYRNQQLIISKKISEAHKHSEIMVATIDEMLKVNNLRYQDLSFVATVKGPGSFTGLRVGLAFLKTLQTVAKIKVIAIDNFTVYAYQYFCSIKHQKIQKHNIFIALDSGNQYVYLCGFDVSQSGFCKNAYLKSLNYNDFMKYLNNNEQKIFIGNVKNLPKNGQQEISINALQELSFIRFQGLSDNYDFDDKIEIFYNIENIL